MPVYPSQKHQVVVQCDLPDNPYSRDEAESDKDAGEDEEDDGDDEDLGSAVLHDETRSLGEVREVHGRRGHGADWREEEEERVGGTGEPELGEKKRRENLGKQQRLREREEEAREKRKRSEGKKVENKGLCCGGSRDQSY